jgi:hypothetical protein
MGLRKQDWRTAVGLVGQLAKGLELLLKAGENPQSKHVPTLQRAVDQTRSAFAEAQAAEKRAYEKIGEPEEGDPNQTVMPLANAGTEGHVEEPPDPTGVSETVGAEA